MRCSLALRVAATAALAALALRGANAQMSLTPTPSAVTGCLARYVRVENTPGVTNQNFYVSLMLFFFYRRPCARLHSATLIVCPSSSSLPYRKCTPTTLPA